MNRLMMNSVCTLVLWHFFSAVAIADQRIIWDKSPIPVQLTVGTELVIQFPGAVRYWLPDQLRSKVDVLSANGVLYLSAIQPFAKTRIRVQVLDTQTLYLLDITGNSESENDNRQETLIITDDTKVVNQSKQQDKDEPPTDWPVRLTRFAAQSLYAPERLSPADSAIRQISVDTHTAVPLIQHPYLEAKPLGAWHGGGLTVTAVLIRNLSQETLSLALYKDSVNPADTDENTLYLSTDLRGHWLTVTPQHTWLTAAGSDEDRTCLYLVSRRRFIEALNKVH